jgi:hypothetical protein
LKNPIITAVLIAGLAQTACAQASCARNGAIFAANPSPATNPDNPYRYQLAITQLPDSSADAAYADLWTFQTFDPRSSKKLSEFRMEYSCPNGGALCQIVVPGSTSAVSSDAILLDHRLRPAVPETQAPYLIVLPGFSSANWVFTNSSPELKSMTFFTTDQVQPDLSDDIVWILKSCGR